MSIGCIKPLCDILTVQDPRIVLVTLEGLENILKVGQIDAKNGVNPYSVLIEEAYGLCIVCVCVCNYNKNIPSPTPSHSSLLFQIPDVVCRLTCSRYPLFQYTDAHTHILT